MTRWVHLLSSRAAELPVVLVGSARRIARVRSSPEWPPLTALHSEDIAVVDLDFLPTAARSPERALAVAQRVPVWIVSGSRAVSPAWLEVVQQQQVRTMEACNLGDWSRVADALTRSLRGPSSEVLLDLLIAANPALTALARILGVLCEDLAQIRRPSTLARHCGIPLASLRTTCRRCGFRRVEHLLTYVRHVLVQELVAHLGCGVGEARDLVGISDLSNHRRQVGRARCSTGTAWRTALLLGIGLAAVGAPSLGASDSSGMWRYRFHIISAVARPWRRRWGRPNE